MIFLLLLVMLDTNHLVLATTLFFVVSLWCRVKPRGSAVAIAAREHVNVNLDGTYNNDPLPTSFDVDFGGGGIFDEVSSRRREDIQFLLGTGKYAR